MMMEKKFSGIILQPHNTPLSEINRQHREILGRILQLGYDSNFSPSCQNEGANWVYPVYPSHFLVQSDFPISELKKKITRCSICPPACKNGFLYRPVEMVGADIQPLPPEILHRILPFLTEEELKHTEIPGGFVFGYVKSSFLDKINVKELNDILEKIKTLNLRVFRLHKIEYTWTFGEVTSPLYWTMELPHWVKIKPIQIL